MYEDVRQQVARWLNIKESSEIIFTRGTTEGINFIADAWASQKFSLGDEIVITQLEHHANYLPWQRVAQRTGATLRVIPVNNDGDLDYSVLDTMINSKTKLVAFSHVSNAIGTVVDVQRIVQRAKKVGARVLLDAAQSAAHKRLDVQQLNVDFLVFSGHKLCGPTGVGVLYIKKDLHDEVQPYQVGGSMVFDVHKDRAMWLASPQKFEAGTPPIAQVIGLGAALEFLEKNVNFEQLQKHEAQLCSQFIYGLKQRGDVCIVGPIKQLQQQGHIVSFVVDGAHAHDVAAYLAAHGICVRAGHHCAQPLSRSLEYLATVRVSFYLYNTQQDVDFLLSVLKKMDKHNLIV
jgi:cysteine desulfurase/selenocysteine lyase